MQLFSRALSRFFDAYISIYGMYVIKTHPKQKKTKSTTNHTDISPQWIAICCRWFLPSSRVYVSHCFQKYHENEMNTDIYL